MLWPTATPFLGEKDRSADVPAFPSTGGRGNAQLITIPIYLYDARPRSALGSRMTLRKRTLALCIAALTSPTALASEASTGATAAAEAADQPTTLDAVQAVGTEPARYHNDASASVLGLSLIHI